jgi:hypothetical protein
MNPENLGICTDEESGVDLNRNYGVDWAPEEFTHKNELCGDYWPGKHAFSEPETRAMRDFIASKKHELKFIINCHTSGNEFIWPYNAKAPNDIETRNPGYLFIFKEIMENARFPEGEGRGNSYEVMGDKMTGDADDYVMSTFGIPSVTAEMGYDGQYFKEWMCKNKKTSFDILSENANWMEYIIKKVPDIAK